jgi:uncharacterized protein YcbK (DUF882 family)
MTREQWDTLEFFKPEGTIDDFGNPWKMDYQLMWMLDRLRRKVGKQFIIHCGYAEKGHSDNSYHYRGMAVDFHVKEMMSVTSNRIIKELWFMGGAHFYPDWNNPGFHLDVGPYRRWRQGRQVGGSIFEEQ